MQLRSLITVIAFSALMTTQARAQTRGEITLWTARAIATVLAEIGSDFERATGYRLVITSDLPDGFARRLSRGERFDLFISGSATVDQWIADGRIVSTTRTDLARSGIGVEVRKGAPKPDIGSVDAFKRALLDAKSIAFLPVGSGLHVARVIDRLGIADSIRAKVTRPESDIVSELVSRGEVELGIVVITQILTTPGVELVGPLPPELQSFVTFTAGVSTRSRTPEIASQLIQFLATPAAATVIRKQGMEPLSAARPIGNAGGAQVRDVDTALRLGLARNWYVRVAEDDTVLAEGRVRRMLNDSAIIGQQRVAIAHVTRLDRRTREGGGAMTGAGLGALAVGGFLFTLVSGFCENECGLEVVGAAVMGGGVGAIIGAFFGEAASPARHQWQRIWPTAER
jgi:molybdate transport system substrate-binding protein